MAIRGLDRQWTLNSVRLYRSVKTKIFIKKTISDIRGTFQLCSFVSSYDCTTMQQKFWFLLNFTQSKHSFRALIWLVERWPAHWYFRQEKESRCQEFRYKDISSIFNKCPDRLITSITAKPYILQNILFHWICSKFFKFQHWHNLFWPPTSWRLSEAKNTPQRPKMVWRSRFIEKSF